MLHLLDVAATEREPGRTHAREHQVLPRRGAAQTLATEPRSGGEPVSLVIGQELGDRYRVTGFLGRGGMGSVYRAFDRVLDEEVALKIVHADDEYLRAEVKLAQQVSHRNVCRVYDVEVIDGHLYVKMEHIAGETLAAHLASNKRLPITRAVSIARAVADGLAAAHARGIVHRDLKPGNVMLDGDRVVLMDFGLAQREGASDLAGTPGYMSPEQLAGDPLDARSDLYALGCLAFEMLVGAPPFGDGTIAEIASRRLAAPCPDVRTVRPDVPAWLAKAISSLLADDSSERSRGARRLSRGPRSWPIALPVAAVAVVAAAAMWWPRSAPTWEPTITDLPDYEENADEPSWSPDGTSIVFSSDRGHRDEWGVYVSTPAGAEPRLISPAGRFCLGARWVRDGSAILMSCYIDGARRIVQQPLDGGPQRDLGPGWSVDDCGDALAVVVSRPTGAAIVLRDRDGRDAHVIDLPGIVGARCDSSGQSIAYIEGQLGAPGSGGDLAIVDRRGHVRELTRGETVNAATFTPDGSAIVFSMERGAKSSLFEVSVTGGAIRELTPHEQYATAPDIAVNGTSIVFDRDRTSTPLFELTPGDAIQRTFRFETLSHVVSAPTSDVIVAARRDRRELAMVAIDLTDFAERTLTTGEALFVSRTGDVVFRAVDDPRRLQAIPLAGGPVAPIATLPAPILDAAEGPDGLHVEIDQAGTSQAWLVRRDGTTVPEHVRGLVIPAPMGGWRIVRVLNGEHMMLELVPPGRPLSEPAFTRIATWGQPAWLSDHEVAYCDPTACHRIDVTTGRDIETTQIRAPGNRPITVGRDGKHWFTTSYVGHVTRHVITNFAERR